MSKRTAGVITAAAGIVTVVVAHPPHPIPYLFESVSMALGLPLVATALTVTGGVVAAREGMAPTDSLGWSLAVDFAPLWGVSLVAAYLATVAGFGLASPLILLSLSLGLAAGLVVAISRRLGR